jgi:hypothetical protein
VLLLSAVRGLILTKKIKMTHGEKWFEKKQNFCINEESEIKGNLPKRMGYNSAAKYYTAKIRGFFEEQLSVNDFDDVEDYFCFFNAKEIFSKMKEDRLKSEL